MILNELFQNGSLVRINIKKLNREDKIKYADFIDKTLVIENLPNVIRIYPTICSVRYIYPDTKIEISIPIYTNLLEKDLQATRNKRINNLCTDWETE
jgi:hypothetical protein